MLSVTRQSQAEPDTTEAAQKHHASIGDGDDCPARMVLDHLTSRWGVVVLTALSDGPLRFYEIRRTNSRISEKMLSQNLRLLQRDGLIERVVESTRPPSVRYRLTELGHDLSSSLELLVERISLRADEVVAAQRDFDH